MKYEKRLRYHRVTQPFLYLMLKICVMMITSIDGYRK